MAREEYNLPLDEASYQHLLTKIDGRLIRKKRYMIPLNDSLTIELDVFEDDLAPLLLAEVEFPDEASALSFTAAKSIISCVSIQSNKKMDRRKPVMEFSVHWQGLLRSFPNNFTLTIRGGFC